MAARPHVQATRSNRKRKSWPFHSIRFVPPENGFRLSFTQPSSFIPFSISWIDFRGVVFSFNDGHDALDVEMASWSSVIRPEIFLSPVAGRAQMTVQTLQETWRMRVTVKIQRRLMKMS